MIEKLKQLIQLGQYDRARRLLKIKGVSLMKLKNLKDCDMTTFPCPVLVESDLLNGEKFWLYHEDIGPIDDLPVLTPHELRRLIS